MEGFHGTRSCHWDPDVDEFHVFWILPDLFEHTFRERTGQHFARACIESRPSA